VWKKPKRSESGPKATWAFVCLKYRRSIMQYLVVVVGPAVLVAVSALHAGA
jgi:hypothetical protein